ncbi:hypothetical protein SAMN05414139_01272 [Burkholderia sp. D7]|nr:hypothetical protein SAMN05414139_01272 [Burkholderia sp. D7]
MDKPHGRRSEGCLRLEHRGIVPIRLHGGYGGYLSIDKIQNRKTKSPVRGLG